MDHTLHHLDLDHLTTLAKGLGELCRGGDCILLYGDLGAGKTTFTAALALGLGVDPRHYVTSPSFALMQEYQGRHVLHHLDLFRLQGREEVEDAGLLEYLFDDGVTVIEWPERLEGLPIPGSLEIILTLEDHALRSATLRCGQGAWTERLAGLPGWMGSEPVRARPLPVSHEA